MTLYAASGKLGRMLSTSWNETALPRSNMFNGSEPVMPRAHFGNTPNGTFDTVGPPIRRLKAGSVPTLSADLEIVKC